MTSRGAPRTITVLYFAAALTAAGTDREFIPLPDELAHFPLSSLPTLLASKHPNTNLEKVLATCRWSVDEEMVDDDDVAAGRVVLTGGEVVGVICPVSGG